MHSLRRRGGGSLGPSNRLRKKADIEQCQKRGAKLHAKHFLILFSSSPTGQSRLAVAVTTKLEKRAVVRNLIKRRIREVFRRARQSFLEPLDVVVVARRGIQECSFEDYRHEILSAFASRKLLKKG